MFVVFTINILCLCSAVPTDYATVCVYGLRYSVNGLGYGQCLPTWAVCCLPRTYVLCIAHGNAMQRLRYGYAYDILAVIWLMYVLYVYVMCMATQRMATQRGSTQRLRLFTSTHVYGYACLRLRVLCMYGCVCMAALRVWPTHVYPYGYKCLRLHVSNATHVYVMAIWLTFHITYNISFMATCMATYCLVVYGYLPY